MIEGHRASNYGYCIDECFMPGKKKGGNLMQADCVKCRAKKEMKDSKAVTMKNKKQATYGICPTCDTRMFRMGKSQVYHTGAGKYS